jgi:hypothetical protein
MPQDKDLEEHLTFLKKLGTQMRLFEMGIVEEPLPQHIMLQLLQLKRAERERPSTS